MGLYLAHSTQEDDADAETQEVYEDQISPEASPVPEPAPTEPPAAANASTPSASPSAAPVPPSAPPPQSAAAAAVPGVTPVVPVVINPLAVLDRMARKVAADTFLDAITAEGLLATPVVRLHAQAMRYVVRSNPADLPRYRQMFVDGYANTGFGPSGLAGQEFDAAVPADVPYAAFYNIMPALTAQQAEALERAEGNASTLAGTAMTRAYHLLAPGGLEDPTFALACAIIRSDLISVGGKLAYSEMDENATIDGREVEDSDIAAIQERIDLLYAPVIGGKKASVLRGMVDRAVNHVAMERSYHDVRDYMLALPPWDGKQRLKYVVRDILRAEPSQKDVAKLVTTFSETRAAFCRMSKSERKANQAVDRGTEPPVWWNTKRGREVVAAVRRVGLSRRMIRKFFIAGVARTMKPGCKHDAVLILNGRQGRMKSTFFRTITPCGRFSDNDMELREKDAKLELRKAFVFEWSELSAVRSARDWEMVKGFLARQDDMVRPPYARRAVVRVRHCVIVGTTNESEFLGDSTGSRRFWVIVVGDNVADLKLAEAQRDQLWAEALSLYRRGVRWWFNADDEQSREDANSAHTVVDPWTPYVGKFLGNLNEGERPSSTTLLTGALEMNPDRTTQADVRRVGKVARSLGYVTTDVWDQTLRKSYKGWMPGPHRNVSEE